jgi:phospholipid/cholesterol/gamma-HCH transport system substrate-binding protein
MAGVEIGRVESVGITNSQVRVTFRVFTKETAVRTDSKATVKFTGLMGQNFVAVDFGTPAGVQATDGAFLQTAEQPDLSQILAKLDNVATGVENLTKSFSGDKIDNLLGPFTDFLKQNQLPLTATIGNLKTISDNIAEGKGTVGMLINDPTLYNTTLVTVSNLQGSMQTLSDDAKLTLEKARGIFADIEKGQGTLGKLMKDETLYNETTTAMTNLREIMQKINRGEGTVGKLVNDETLLKNLKLSLQKLDKATEGLEDTGPLQVISTAVGSLF